MAQQKVAQAPAATIGDVLEQVGIFSSNEPLDDKDVKAIESAEALATGKPSGVSGGPASEARSVVGHEPSSPFAQVDHQATLGDVLHDCKTRLQSDKVVTDQDAESVMSVERGENPKAELRPGHVGATMAEAAVYNKLQCDTTL